MKWEKTLMRKREIMNGELTNFDRLYEKDDILVRWHHLNKFSSLKYVEKADLHEQWHEITCEQVIEQVFFFMNSQSIDSKNKSVIPRFGGRLPFS